MRVPSIGLPLDERRIVREGYRIAERMLAGYQDPPSLLETLASWLAIARQQLHGVYQAMLRN
ncbi:hypothetical protein [Devosia beringensis]|uniref:hypothetical protein n=1 Tax=Devosia beringensis TaxID=2657486 RepID=UPI00186BA9D7|nr:hypothetical protein [Devosia beringensis]